MTKQPTLVVPPAGTRTLRILHNSFTAQTTVNVGALERLASLAVGVTILYLTVRRVLLYGSLLLTGGYLLYRGFTGYCPLYASEQIDTRHWRPTAPTRSRLPPALRDWRLWLSRPQRNAAYVKRSTVYEQDDLTRQMATDAWQPENGVGAPD